jgi:peptidoglycan/xylan/chitin deacetylase (PgdA/CDA1 family)/LysM repeat protein
MRAMRLAALAGVIVLAGCGATASPSAPASDQPPIAASPTGAVRPTPSPDATTTPSVTASPAPTASPAGTTYVVVAGDTLSSIAVRFATTVAQLQAWNGGRYPSLADDPSAIAVGWTLVVAGEPGVTPRPTPAATPAPTPPPAGSGCTAGNRVAAGSAQTFYAIPNAGHAVALTFDMGGRMDPAVEIMNFLVANEVCATIFATGVMSETPQGEEVMAIIREHPELFEIANHTMYHCDLARGGGGSPTTAPCQTNGAPADFIRRELTDAEAVLRAGTGQQPQPYWRPPYGSVNAAVINAAASVGYTTTFMWDIDTIDWKPTSQGGPSAEQIAAKVVGNAGDGSNVLFHLGGYETLDALRLIVPAMRDQGYQLTSLSDLLD